MDRAKNFLKSFKPDNQSGSTRAELEVHETICSNDFRLSQVVRHGFPYEPSCMAYDSVQKLLAVGTKKGSIRIFGKAGVDYYLKHESEAEVFQLQFLVNEGALITACKDDCVHLWNFRQKKPEIVHSVQFQREGISFVHLPFQSKWLYVGSDKGNVHVVSIQAFTLSGYVINWNKAIDLSQKNHPGKVVHLSGCPNDENKLLVGFEKGTVVLWDLKLRQADARFQCEQFVRSICWHYDGKQFICAHQDGSLSVWQPSTKPQKPIQHWAPHSRAKTADNDTNSGTKPIREKCRPITQIEWRHSRETEEYVVFAGGLPQDESGVLPAVTVLRGGRSATVLEMEHSIVAFKTLCNSPFENDVHEPFAIAVLLKTDFLIVDLTTNGYPCFENPYPMDIHESPVTCCKYWADCPTDLIAAYYSVGSKQKRQKFSEKSWPITGGEPRQGASGNTEIVLTGHADGSVKFWDATSDNLQVLYKLKTGRHFERPSDQLGRDFSAFAVTEISLCPESKCLAIASQAAQVTFFRFIRQEAATEIPVLEVPITRNTCMPEKGTAAAAINESRHRSSTTDLRRQHSVSSLNSGHSSVSSEETELFYPVKVRPGPFKRPAGYQPELVCLTPWLNHTTPEIVRIVALNTAYGLMAYGTEQGLAVIDILQHTPVFVCSSQQLYGTSGLPRTQISNASDTSNHGAEVFGTESEALASPAIENKENGTIGTQPMDDMKMKSRSSASRLAQQDRAKSQGASPFSLRRPFLKAQTVASAGCLAEPELSGLASAAVYAAAAAEKECRSRSSSVSSQDNLMAPEGVSSLSFLDSFGCKNDSSSNPCLWVGTSIGSCVILNLHVPAESRLDQPVLAAPSGSVFRVKGGVIAIGFLDREFYLLAPPCDSWKDSNRDSDKLFQNRVLKGTTRRRVSPTTSSNLDSAASSNVSEDFQYLVLVGERQCRVVGLPTHNSYFVLKTEPFLAKAELITMLGSPIILGLTVNGNITATSLPSLRPLLNCNLLSNVNSSIVNTFCLSQHGHGMYLSTPSEIQKFTVSAELTAQLSEVMGDLFQGCDMPEPPKQGFFKGLFSGNSVSLDREELFGEASGKASKSVAKHIPGPSAIDPIRAQSNSATGEVGKTKMQLIERGEKLGEVEERTAMMAEGARAYHEHTNELVNKMKNKKWYHL